MSHYISTTHNSNQIHFETPEEKRESYSKESGESICQIINSVNDYISGEYELALEKLKTAMLSPTLPSSFKMAIGSIINALHPGVESACYSFSIYDDLDFMRLNMASHNPGTEALTLTNEPVPISLKLTHAIVDLIVANYDFPSDKITASWVAYWRDNEQDKKIDHIQFHSLEGSVIHTQDCSAFNQIIKPASSEDPHDTPQGIEERILENLPWSNRFGPEGFIYDDSLNHVLERGEENRLDTLFDLAKPFNLLINKIYKHCLLINQFDELVDGVFLKHKNRQPSDDVDLNSIATEIITELRGKNSQLDSLINQLERVITSHASSQDVYNAEQNNLYKFIVYNTRWGLNRTVPISTAVTKEDFDKAIANGFSVDNAHWISMIHSLSGVESANYLYTIENIMDDGIGQLVVNVYEGKATIFHDDEIHFRLLNQKTSHELRETAQVML